LDKLAQRQITVFVFLFAMGTVLSRNEPIQYVYSCVYIRIVGVTTALTSKTFLTQSVHPIGMTTFWASDTGFIRRHTAKRNTVFFALLLKSA